MGTPAILMVRSLVGKEYVIKLTGPVVLGVQLEHGDTFVTAYALMTASNVSSSISPHVENVTVDVMDLAVKHIAVLIVSKDLGLRSVIRKMEPVYMDVKIVIGDPPVTRHVRQGVKMINVRTSRVNVCMAVKKFTKEYATMRSSMLGHYVKKK